MSNRRKLYDALVKDYDMGTFEQFESDIQDETKRKRLFDAISNEYDMGTYDQFSEQLLDGLTVASDGGVRMTEPKEDAVTPQATSEEIAQIENFNNANIFPQMQDTNLPFRTIEEKKESARIEEQIAAEEAALAAHREAERKRLHEDGTIQRMENAKREARGRKLGNLGLMMLNGAGSAASVTGGNMGVELPEGVDIEQVAEEHRQNKLLHQRLDETLDMVRQGDINAEGSLGIGDATRGAWDSATRLSTWDVGISETLNALTYYDLVKKWEENPESLTATENALLDAIAETEYVNSLYSDQTGFWYGVGQSLPQSAAFMGETMLNPANALGQTAMKKVVRELGKRGVSAAARRGAGITTRVVGDIAEAAIGTATTRAGHVIGGAIDRNLGSMDFRVDNNGYVHYEGQEDDGVGGWESLNKEFGAQFLGGYSEKIGSTLIDPALDVLRGVTKGAVTFERLDKFVDALNNTKASKLMNGISNLRKKAHLDSTLAEILEEEFDMLMNARFIGDNNFGDPSDPNSVFNLRNQLTTIASTALTMFGINAVESAGNYANRRTWEKQVAEFDKAAGKLYGDGWESLRESIDMKSPQEVVDELTGIFMNQDVTLAQKRAIMNYAMGRIGLQSYNVMDKKVRDELYFEKKNALDAYEAGRHAQLPQYYNIDQAYRRSEAAINERENAEEIWDAIRLMNNMDENEQQNIMRDFSEEDQELIRNWRYNAYRWQGAVDHRTEQVEDLVDEYRGQVTPYTRPDGTLTTAILGDDVVYVMNEAENGDAVVYTNDGRKIFCKMRDLEHVQQHNAEELIERFRQQTTQAVEQETEKNLNYPSEVLEPAQGVTVETLDGKQWQVAATDGENVEIVGLVFDKKSGQWIPNAGDYRKMTREQFMDWQKAELDRKKANTYEQGDELTFYVNGEPIDAEITGIDPEGNYMVQISHLADGLDKAVSDVYTAEELRKLTTPSSKVLVETTENESTSNEEIKQSVSEEVTNSQIGDTVGGSPVALSYLLEGGQGSIESAGYFLHGVAAAFPNITNEIEAIRNNMDGSVLGMNPMDFVGSGAQEIDAIRSLVSRTYGDEGVAIYNELLANSTGFVPKVGAALWQRIESLSETMPQSTEQGGNVTEPTAEVEESVNTALSRVPKDAKGNPLYEQTDADTAWDAIVEETGGDAEMAQRIAEEMVADKKAALAKIQKGKPKKGATVAEKIANEKAHIAAIAQAESEVAAWEKIAQVNAIRQQKAELERAEAEKAAAEQRKAEEARILAEQEEQARIEREALNGVPDMVDDVPADARARGYRRVNGHKVDRQGVLPSLQGKEVGVKFANDMIVNGRVAVIEAETLQPSHLQGQRNPSHFIDEAQPKERNDEASIASARKIASNIRPEEITSSVTAYTGAPTVNMRGEAIQGNSRSDALRVMWAEHPDQAEMYKQYLIDHAEEFGLNAEEVAAMQHPVLVNMLDVSDTDAINLGQYVAQDTESGGTERIKAKNVARKMGSDIRSYANILLRSSEEDASFSELVDKNGVEVLKWMNTKGYITPTQYASAFDSKGNLTAEAKNDLRGILYQSIFQGGNTQLEEQFNSLPAKAQKAILATAYRDYDSLETERMVDEIQSSIRAYYALSRDRAFVDAKNYKEAKEAMLVWSRQYQMDDATGESFLPSENFSNFALELAVVYKGWTQTNIQSHFNNVYDLVQGTKEASLFEEADNTPRTLAEAIKETFNIEYNGQLNSNSLAVDSQDGQAGERGSDVDTASGERAESGEGSADSGRGTDAAREQGEVDGKRKVTANYFEMAEEAQKKRKSKKKKDDKQTNQNLQEERKEGVATTGAGKSRPSGTFSISYYTQFLKELFQNAHWEERPSEEVAGIIRRHNAGKTLLARTEDERELLSALRALTNNEIQDELSNINNALQSDEYTDEEKEELKRAKNLITRFVNRGERNAVIEALTGAKLGEKLPLSKIDELFEMYNSDANVAELYARVRAIAEQIGLDFWFEEMEDRLLGGYLHSDNRVRLNAHMLYCPRMQRQGVASTIVHEMLHAVAGYAVYTQKDIKLGLTPKVQLSKQVLSAANTIINIYEKAVKGNPALVHQEYDIEKEEWIEVADYGTTSVHEMLSEISNPEFRDKLKQIEYNGRSVWHRIWDTLKSMFTQPSDVTNPTAYDSMARALDVLINEFSVDAYRKYSGLEESAMKLSAEENLRFREKEEPKELIAVHNISEGNLKKVLEAGSLIMPSIAITKADMGHDSFGEISLLFDKSTINPSDRRNKVYGGDAWTPRFPRIGVKLNEKVVSRINKKAYELIDDRRLREIFSISSEVYPDNIEKVISDYGVEGYYNKEWMKLAYLLDNGKKVKIPTKARDYGIASEDIVRLAKEKGLSVKEIYEDYDFYKNNPDFVAQVKEARDEARLSSIPEEQRDEMRERMQSRPLSEAAFDSYIRGALEMENDLAHGGLKEVVDRQALRDLIEKKVKTDNAEYNKWVDNLFEGIVEKRGIRNNRDWYTPSGDLRPWGQLYDPATPANILKYMLAENEQGGSGGLFDSNIMGASAETYESIEEIREKGQQRLKKLPYEEYDEWSNSVAERMAKICDDFLSPSQKNSIGGAIDAKIEITNAVSKDKTAKGIYKHMKREYPNFTMEHAKQVEEIVKEIQESATGYFEAKPQRLVSVNEVMAAVVPSNASKEIVDALKSNSIEVITYKKGDEEARKRVVKRVSSSMDIKFREGMGAISDREVSYENDPIAKWQGKPRYYGKRASAFAERERSRMQKGVEKAANILGIEVEIITDASSLKGRKAKAKGWYDINAKKVVVVVPNHVSKGDAVRTVLHEGVAHHGLRELFGAGFDAMLDNIYNNVAPELKARIDAIAERTGVSTSVATEEYLASLAEDTEFEYANKMGWWDKIKRYFVDMLRKLSMPGLNLKEEITDNELRYLLWRSYQNLVDPNRYLKPLGYLDDVAKQKELKVGNYAENTMATPRAAEMSEAEEWASVTMQRIEELEAQAVQLENEIADMEAGRDADDASRYDVWEQQLDPLRAQLEDVYAEIEGLYTLSGEEEVDEEEREAEKQRQLYQKRIDNAYLKAVREGDWEEATDLFRQYVLSKAEDEGIVPMDYGVGYRGGAHSSIAKKVKEENPDAIAEAAYQMSIRIPKGSILVPMPSRTGNATYTVKLAEAIAKATDSEVRDVLKGKARMSVYEAKQKGIKMTPEDLGMYTTEELPKGKNIVIIDNVIDKGTTALAAVSAVKGASVVAYAYTLGDKQRAATLKLAEPVTYDDNKRIIPLSQRFDKETDDIRYRLVGGNSGYVGYSMSKRAAQARVEGRFPKTDFKKEYGINDKVLDTLVKLGIINNTEWHHTSKYGNKTPFYGWEEVSYADYYEQHREEIVQRIKAGETDGLVEEFEAYEEEQERLRRERLTNDMELTREYGQYREENAPTIPAEYNASNGVRVVTNGSSKHSDWKYYWGENEAFKKYARAAESELSDKLRAEDSRMSFTEWKAKRNADEIIAEVEREAGALGVPVRIVRSADELPDEDTRKRAVDGQLKGYFDPRTGEVVVYEPNTDNANDAKRTILHETVGHKGLRQLIGEERYDKAMVQLMYMLPSEVRDSVLRRAELHGWNAAIAMDEYLADQAERDVQPTWWGKVNAKIRAILRNMGFNVMLTDADVTYLLWRSRKKLMGDTAFDMATDAILKQAARKSAEADAWNEQAFKDAEMRDFEKNELKQWRYRTGEAQNEYERHLETISYKFSEAYQDRMASLKVLQEAVEKESGKKIADWENAWMDENRMSSVNLAEIEMFREGYLEKVAKEGADIEKSGVKHQELIDYMFAKHGLERNETMARERAEKEAEGDAAKEATLYAKYRDNDFAGLTALTGKENVADAEADAMQMVSDFEANHSTDLLWGALREANNETLRISYDAGIIDEETYNNLRDKYKYYIPLRGFAEKTAEDVYLYVDGHNSPYNAPIKTAKGRKSKADDPFAHIESMATSAIVEANRNKLKQKMLYMAERHHTDLMSVSDVWVESVDVRMDDGTTVQEWHTVFANIPDDATTEQAIQIQKAFEEDMEQKAKSAPDKYAKVSEKPNIPYRVVKQESGNQHQIVVKRGGKDVVIIVNGNPRAAQAVNGLTNRQATENKFIRSLRWVNRQQSANYTARNLVFMIKNLTKDSQYTKVMAFMKEPLSYGARFWRNWWISTVKVPALLAKYKKTIRKESGGLDMSKPIERMFYEFISQGGETGYTHINTIEDYKKEMKLMILKHKGGIVGMGIKSWDALTGTLRGFCQWAEDTSRFAAYMTSRETGRSLTKSVNDAKEISVNFNRAGSGSRMVGEFSQSPAGYIAGVSAEACLIMWNFFNANVQGISNFYREAAKHPYKFAVVVVANMLYGFLHAMMASAGDDDEDKDNKYYDLPAWKRRMCHTFRVGDNWLCVPMAISFAPFYALGELAYSYFSGREKYTDAEIAAEVAKIAATAALPVDVTANHWLAPDALSPALEVAWFNEDWTGKPIYKQRYDDSKPTWELAYKSTNPHLVAISKAINEATNTDIEKKDAKGNITVLEDYKDRGWADSDFWTNAAGWEHMMEGYLGGNVKFVNDIVKSIQSVKNIDLRNVQTYPIVNSFIMEGGEKGYVTRGKVYEAKKEIQDMKSKINSYGRETKDSDLPEADRKRAEELREALFNRDMQTIATFENLEKQRQYYQTKYDENPNAKENISTYDKYNRPVGKKEVPVKDLLFDVMHKQLDVWDDYKFGEDYKPIISIGD